MKVSYAKSYQVRVGVVLPTVTGREELLRRTREGYEAATPKDVELMIVSPRDADGVAEGWELGVAALDGCDFIHLSADDVLPGPSWAEAAILAAEDGVYPSPRILKVDGSLESCGTLGGGLWLEEMEDGAPAGASGFPFFAADLWDAIRPLPRIHYFADDFVAYQARRQGLIPKVVRDYCFTHLEGQVGRLRHEAKNLYDRQVYRLAIAERAFKRGGVVPA